MRRISNTILGMEELRKMFTRVILTPKPVEEMMHSLVTQASI